MLVKGLLAHLFPTTTAFRSLYVTTMATWWNMTCTDWCFAWLTCKLFSHIVRSIINLRFINCPCCVLHHSLFWSPCSSDKSLITAACALDTWHLVCWTNCKSNLFKAAPAALFTCSQKMAVGAEGFQIRHPCGCGSSDKLHAACKRMSGYQRQRGKWSNTDETLSLSSLLFRVQSAFPSFSIFPQVKSVGLGDILFEQIRWVWGLSLGTLCYKHI